MDIIRQRSKSDKEGNTTANGSYTLMSDGSLSTSFTVRYKSRSGSGKGRMACALIGEDGKVIFDYHKGFTVGSNPTKPDVTKNDDQTFDILQLDKIVSIAFTVDAVSSDIGIPKSINEWKELLGSDLLPIIGDLGIGDFKEIGGWVIDRIR